MDPRRAAVSRRNRRKVGGLRILPDLEAMRNAFACVGLIVLAGCFTLIVVPDSELPWLRSAPPHPPSELPTVVIDPGHGGNDDGASAYGLKEKDLTLAIALKVEAALKSYNFPTLMTRRNDCYVPLSERVEMANRIENSIFVSIHLNSDYRSAAGGVETFYSREKAPAAADWSWIGFFNRKAAKPADTGEVLAGFIQTSLVIKTDLPNRGIKSRSLFVTRNVCNPAVLVETGFISNAIEAALLRNDDYRQRLAAAIAEGILSYQKTRDQPVEEPPERLVKVFR
jgi:N-acetylmuramoyl-L-alanine amidase